MNYCLGQKIKKKLKLENIKNSEKYDALKIIQNIKELLENPSE